MSSYARSELNEFCRLRNKAMNDADPAVRQIAKRELAKFVERTGKAKCDEMFADLQIMEDRRKEKNGGRL